MKRKIAIFTGNRAEYGMQKPIIRAIALDKRLDYQLIVSGAHLDNKFGRTIQEIKNDGFSVAGEVDITSKGDTLFDTTQAIGMGISSLSRVLKRLKPDIFLVYADRFESFAALITGTQMGIPTVHAEGGDITEGGALDDMVRHAMSKLAHLHLTTNEDATKRLIKMGEEPWRIFTVGYPGIDLIKENDFSSPQEISRKFGIDLSSPLVICTQHSIATEADDAVKQIEPVIQALRRLSEENVRIVMTFPNNDAGGVRIMSKIKSACRNNEKMQVFESIGRRNYYGFLNICGKAGIGACVGNSSSGIKETPAFGCPAVNIGDRQKGRLRANNVIDTGYNSQEIYNAIKKCLFDKGFRKRCQACSNPYDKGGVGKKVANILSTVRINMRLLQKKLTY